jgi:hypothetical protein
MARKPSDETYALMRRAIVEHFPLTAYYKGSIRHFSPYALGADKERQPATFVWQYGGKSDSGPLPDWRCFKLRYLSQVRRNKDPWRDEQGSHGNANSCVVNVDVEVGTWRSKPRS